MAKNPKMASVQPCPSPLSAFDQAVHDQVDYCFAIWKAPVENYNVKRIKETVCQELRDMYEFVKLLEADKVQVYDLIRKEFDYHWLVIQTILGTVTIQSKSGYQYRTERDLIENINTEESPFGLYLEALLE